MIVPAPAQSGAAVTSRDTTEAFDVEKVVADENCAISCTFDLAESVFSLALRRQCCQYVQRLLKTLHRDDAKAVRVPLRLARIVPIDRDEEDIDVRLARSDR